MGTTTRAMSAQAEAKSKSQERIQVPVMDDRAASAVRFDELAHMGHPMGHPMEMGHPMDYGMHPGHHAGVGYDYGFMPGPAPPPVWQNQYMEMNGFKGPMPNWQPASASSHFPAGSTHLRMPRVSLHRESKASLSPLSFGSAHLLWRQTTRTNGWYFAKRLKSILLQSNCGWRPLNTSPTQMMRECC